MKIITALLNVTLMAASTPPTPVQEKKSMYSRQIRAAEHDKIKPKNYKNLT